LFNNYENNYIFKILLKVYYMQVRGGLKSIFKKMGNTIKNDLDTIIKNNVENSFGKFKNKIGGLLEYSYKKLEEIKNNAYYEFQKVKDGMSEYGTIIKDKIERLPEYLDKKLEEIRYKISEYKPAIASAALASLPPLIRIPVMAGFYIENVYKGPVGKILKYVLIVSGIGIPVGLGILLLHPIHPLPSNNEHIQYVGSPNGYGYEAFVPNGQTINSNPTGILILNNGTEIKNVIWTGQYATTIIQNHNQIVQLNNQFNGEMLDFYVIKGQVPIMNTTIDGQTYYVIDANNINPADIAGFYTYQGWVTDFVKAMNTPGTYAAGLPGNSPVFQWENLTGTVAYQTMVYGRYGPFDGGVVLVLPNGTIIPYGTTYYPSGTSLNNYTLVQQIYNPPS